ncbi:MAG: NADP-dependent malic enzyme [Candidatus Marsarchaeota archaeon]|nr:NADP-dependent malic enzyme [Candidatus Marsarchaeota archaeon]
MPSDEEILRIYESSKGAIETVPKVRVSSREDLAIHYTPGVATVCNAIKNDKSKVFSYTGKSNMVAIITDGSRILGLGNIGPEAGLPVMEAKAMLFKKYGGVDAIPICLDTQEEEAIIQTVKNLAPTFGGFNIEDIESPKCFRIVDRLAKELEVPVLHDDQHGTAMVAVAALINAMKLAGKELTKIKIVINGAGAAGLGIVRLLGYMKIKNIYVVDSAGVIFDGRKENMNEFKKEIAASTNPEKFQGSLMDVVDKADVLIGASSANVFTKEMIQKMAERPVVFALANPVPEISYADAKASGAFIVATGRSDTPNQVNNVLSFPNIMRGLLDSGAKRVDYDLLYEASKALAKCVGKDLGPEHILPSPYEPKEMANVLSSVASAVAASAVKSGNTRHSEVDISAIKKNAARIIKRSVKIEKIVIKTQVPQGA